MGLSDQSHAPAALPSRNTPHPFYGSQGRYGRMRKISPSTGFDLRTVQPLPSRYTDCAIQEQNYTDVNTEIKRVSGKISSQITAERHDSQARS
jgi:hypothetical protein